MSGSTQRRSRPGPRQEMQLSRVAGRHLEEGVVASIWYDSRLRRRASATAAVRDGTSSRVRIAETFGTRGDGRASRSSCLSGGRLQRGTLIRASTAPRRGVLPGTTVHQRRAARRRRRRPV